MSGALLMFGYALIAAWCLPVLLARLTAAGLNTRLGLAAWLVTMGAVLASLAAGLLSLISAAAAGWSLLAEAVCRSATGHTCPPAVYRSAIFEVPIAVTAGGGVLMAAVLAWRYGRRLHRAQRRTREHADAARITGRPLPEASGAIVLDAPQATAYCVPGRPAAIVLTSAALALLDPAQLAAVVAHERAHLAGTHHLLVLLTRGLAAVFPAVPLFTRGTAEVTRLTEMRADDLAVRASGRPVFITALLAMGTGVAIPSLALGATSGDVAARVQRLLEPPPRSRHARNWLALVAEMVLLAVTFVLLTRFGETASW